MKISSHCVDFLLEALDHSSWSPELVPSDYFQFRFLKKVLGVGGLPEMIN
jgi:hypothetical protein